MLPSSMQGASAVSTTPGVSGTNSVSGTGVEGKSAQGEGVHGETNSITAAAVAGISNNVANTGGAVSGWQYGNGSGVFGHSAAGEGLHGETNGPASAAVAGIALNPKGTGAAIYGESRGKGPAGFFKGVIQVTKDIQVLGGDCAEHFEVVDSARCAPGTVMVIDGSGLLVPCHQAYDRCVAGVAAGGGDLRPGIVLNGHGEVEGRVPIALLGQVYCQVTAEPSAIAVGDLLTTSDITGHAMKAGDPARAFGAVIGKALQPLPAGRGLIRILIALQ